MCTDNVVGDVDGGDEVDDGGDGGGDAARGGVGDIGRYLVDE